jgi:hypothetical protein
MEFEIGDEVVYNPYGISLRHAHKRMYEWGKITQITDNYIYLKFYGLSFAPHKIHYSKISHSPYSLKHHKSKYLLVMKEILDTIPLTIIC